MSTVTTIGADPDRIDIEVTPGEAVDFTVSVLDATGAAQDLTGWALSATISAIRDSAVLHTFALDLLPAGIRLSATGAQTATWANWLAPVARWTLWFTPPASQPYLFAAGWVRVSTH